MTGSTTDTTLMARLGLERSRYEGPTGIVGVLHDACRAAGFTSASLWAPVPHYVATPPNPPATRALLDRFAAFTGRTLDLARARGRVGAWARAVDSAVDADDEMRDVRAARSRSRATSSPTTTEPRRTGGHPERRRRSPAAFEEYLRDQDTE